MSDYTKLTDFAAKDSLLTGNPAKIITGTAHDNEYNAIATAIASKVDESSLGTGVATFLATPSSANLAAAVTGETGSGALVFGTSPTISGATLNTAVTATISTGTGTGLTLSNANSTTSQQQSISGSMTADVATPSALSISTALTGGASSTAMRGLLFNTTYTPTANASLQNIYNQFSLNNGASPASAYGQSNVFILGASAIGGTIPNFYGNSVGFSPNASATTNITAWTSFIASNIPDGTAMAVGTAYAFYSAMNTAAGTRWGFYHAGTADNAFNGNTRFGGVTAPTVPVDVTGAILATTFIRSSGATSGIGYTTGAGGTVTQATSKATGVTLNKVTGEITMNSAALAAGTIVSFTLTNSAIEATDMLVVQHESAGTVGAYTCTSNCAAGSATIYVRNNTAGSLSEAIVLKYILVKSVTA